MLYCYMKNMEAVMQGKYRILLITFKWFLFHFLFCWFHFESNRYIWTSYNLVLTCYKKCKTISRLENEVLFVAFCKSFQREMNNAKSCLHRQLLYWTGSQLSCSFHYWLQDFFASLPFSFLLLFQANFNRQTSALTPGSSN